MRWLKAYTDKIKALLEASDPASVTYAALEARLALEHVCYERLRIAHDLISADDLRTWTPRYVVQTVIQMVDPHVASSWTLSIKPISDNKPIPGDRSEGWTTVGSQAGFDPKRIGQLWQAMGSFLHTELPQSRDHSISHYRQADKVRSKVQEVLQELDRISKGTITGYIVPEIVSFKCDDCGKENRRSKQALKHNEIVNCIKEGCKEQYRVEKSGDELSFERLHILVACRNCNKENAFAHRGMAELPKDKIATFTCECGEKNFVRWKLMQAAPLKDKPTSIADE